MSPLIRESSYRKGAERLLKGRNTEGSFQAGEPRAKAICVVVSSHALSPLTDRTLQLARERSSMRQFVTEL